MKIIGGDKLNINEPRYTYIPPVRVSEVELKKINLRARELGLNRSEYVRKCIEEEMSK